MSLNGQSDAVLLVFAWATPNNGMSLDDLIAHMAEIGNEVLEVDRANNRLKLMDQTCNLSPEQARRMIAQMESEGVNRG